MTTPLMTLVARMLFLPMIVFAFALLVKGYTSTGGGFAAGAIAGLAVLLQRIVFGQHTAEGILGRRARQTALALGLALPLGVALAPSWLGEPFLLHFPRPGHHVVRLGALELHTSLVFDMGIALLVLAFALEAVRLVSPSPGEEE